MPTVQDVTSNSKIAIVTGGSRGLGRNTVLSLAKRGVHAIFTYNSNRAEAEKVVGLLGKTGQKAVALELDAGNVSTFDNFVEKVRQPLGSLGAVRFDYLVNNAGISHHNSIDQTGFCLGGTLTYGAATNLPGFSVAVGYYGGLIVRMADQSPKIPTMLHFGELDAHIPMSDVETIKSKQPSVEVYTL